MTFAGPDSAADPDLRRGELAELRRQLGRLEYVLAHEAGRAFVWGLLRRAGYFAVSPIATTAEHLQYREGQRSVVSELVGLMVTRFPESFSDLLRENATTTE